MAGNSPKSPFPDRLPGTLAAAQASAAAGGRYAMPPEQKSGEDTRPERSAGSGQPPEAQLPDGVPAQSCLLSAQQGSAGQPPSVPSPAQPQQAGRLDAPRDMTEPGEAGSAPAGGPREGMEVRPVQLEQPAEQALACPAPADAQRADQVHKRDVVSSCQPCNRNDDRTPQRGPCVLGL